jgi:hypothetical protein
MEEMTSRSIDHQVSLFNSHLETGIRALVLLDALHPRSCDLTEMTWFDHLVVHTSDLEGFGDAEVPDTQIWRVGLESSSCDVDWSRKACVSCRAFISSKRNTSKRAYILSPARMPLAFVSSPGTVYSRVERTC